MYVHVLFMYMGWMDGWMDEAWRVVLWLQNYAAPMIVGIVIKLNLLLSPFIHNF